MNHSIRLDGLILSAYISPWKNLPYSSLLSTRKSLHERVWNTREKKSLHDYRTALESTDRKLKLKFNATRSCYTLDFSSITANCKWPTVAPISKVAPGGKVNALPPQRSSSFDRFLISDTLQCRIVFSTFYHEIESGTNHVRSTQPSFDRWQPNRLHGPPLTDNSPFVTLAASFSIFLPPNLLLLHGCRHNVVLDFVTLI